MPLLLQTEVSASQRLFMLGVQTLRSH